MGETCQFFLGQMAVASERFCGGFPQLSFTFVSQMAAASEKVLVLYICCPVSFWGQSCVNWETNVENSLGNTPKDFLRGESHFLQRTPEDKHVILPQDLYYGLKTPKLTLWHPGRGDSFSERHRKGKIF